jgi:hypothetical protein
MKFSYLFFICAVALVLKACMVETPTGRKIDLRHLPKIGSDLARFAEKIARPILIMAQKNGVDLPPALTEKINGARARREAENSKRNSDGWSAVRVTDPALINQCIDIWGPHPEGPRKLGDWRSALGCSVEEANEWRSISPNLKRWTEWKAQGLLPSDASGWLSSKPITPQETRLWIDAGFTSEIANSWRDFGYSPKDAAEQSFGGVLSLPDARALIAEFRATGIESSGINIQDWIDCGFSRLNLTSIPQWIQHGFLPSEAQQWGNYPAASAEWRAAGFEPGEFTIWKSAHFSISAESAKQWIAAGISAQEFSSWRNSEINFAVEWKSAGFASEEIAQQWSAQGFTAMEAAPWRRNEVTPARACLWIEVGQTDPRLVRNINRMSSDLSPVLEKLKSGMSLNDIELELDSSPGDIGLAD